MLRYVISSAATHARHCLHMQTSKSMELAPIRDNGIVIACMPFSKHSTDAMLKACFGTQLIQHPATDMCPVWQDVCLPQKCNIQSNLIDQLGTCKLHIMNMPLLSATQPSTEAWETSKCGAAGILFVWQVNCGYPYVQKQVSGTPWLSFHLDVAQPSQCNTNVCGCMCKSSVYIMQAQASVNTLD